MREDRPFHLGTYVAFLWFTPHARGSTTTFRGPTSAEPVYPAYLGIDLERGKHKQENKFTPHARIDPSVEG